MARDPAIGRWQLNLIKSTFKLFAAPKSSVMGFWGEDGLKWKVHMVGAQGNQLTPIAAYKFDGRDDPAESHSRRRYGLREIEW
jgi:hypothetical protein